MAFSELLSRSLVAGKLHLQPASHAGQNVVDKGINHAADKTPTRFSRTVLRVSIEGID